ncbi:MAG: hypothetical protein ABWK01_08950 [Infirmifilum sp.]
MPLSLGTVIQFIIAWLVSAIIIYIVLKLYPGRQKRENIGGALLAALVGEIIFLLFDILHIPFGNLLSILVWLYALRKLFGVGWIGALIIAFLIYVLSLLTSFLGLPHLF